MPRTVEEILAHADDLARRFEEDNLGPAQVVGGASLREVRKAFEAKARAERDMADAVTVARAEGHSWAAIGAMLGTSGEAARQRYGQVPSKAKPSKKSRLRGTELGAEATLRRKLRAGSPARGKRASGQSSAAKKAS
jgi:hypothetical protein